MADALPAVRRPLVTDASPEARGWLARAARPARPWILMSIWAGATEGVLLVVQASLVAAIVHGAFLGGRGAAAMSGWLLGLAAAIAGRAVAVYLREVAGFRAGARVRAEVRGALLGRLLGTVDAQPLGGVGRAGGVEEATGAGALATAVQEQVEALHDHVARYLPQRALAAVVPVTILVAVAPLSWAAAALLVFTAPCIPLLGWLVGLGASRASAKQFAALGRLGTHFVDRLHGLPTLRILDRCEAEARAVGEAAEEYRRRTMTVLRVAFLTSAVLEFFAALGVGMMAVYLGLTLAGSWSFGLWGRPLTFEVALFLLILAAEFFLPLRGLGTLFHARNAALGAAQRLRLLLEGAPPEASSEAPSEAPPGAAAAPALDPRAALRLEGVTVQPPGAARPLLGEVNLEIQPGELLAVVGPSGAGKTTLLGLLLGAHRPVAGRLCLGDVDLEAVGLAARRQHLAWVGQSPRLFHGTLRANIALARPGADAAAVEAAARAAGVLEFAQALPAGLDTAVGELGVGLSGGQIQRVALARAFLKDAPILLLDEPTANLDGENEAAVLAAMEALRPGRTVVLVTHRPAACRGADRVVVLAEGAVVETGPHDALVQAGGAYARWLADAGEPWPGREGDHA